MLDFQFLSFLSRKVKLVPALQLKFYISKTWMRASVLSAILAMSAIDQAEFMTLLWHDLTLKHK